MDPRRLDLLLQLSRLGSMRAVAEERRLTTSTVSQQIATLAREAGTPLVEPDGRRVRLTPAGRRLADHAVTILAAIEVARRDLDPGSEPAGTVRVGGFATCIRRTLLPVVDRLDTTHPDTRVVVSELEPGEAYAALAVDDIDLALVYDYDLAPSGPPDDVEAVHLWSADWGLAVPEGDGLPSGDATTVMAAYAGHGWIVNSRNTADESVVRILASRAGFTPQVRHRADSLDLVEHLVASGFGVGLVPVDRDLRPGVRVLPLRDPGAALRAYAATRRGRSAWSPLRLVLDHLVAGSEQ